MIKCEVFIDGNKITVNGYDINILQYPETGLFYQVEGFAATCGGIHYDLEEAIHYCLEN